MRKDAKRKAQQDTTCAYQHLQTGVLSHIRRAEMSD
jgi:hypothetical protein